jgi:ketosteroid isomerase-like protein
MERKIKNHILLILLVFLLCFNFNCHKQSKETAMKPDMNIEADVSAVKALLAEWVQLYNTGNFDNLMSIFYAENSILMSPNESIRKGKDAILLSYQKDSELNKQYVDSSVVEDVRVSGDLAVARGMDTGTTTPRSGGETAKYNLKWLIVFERQSDHTWKCIYEIWNDNNSLPEPSAKT